MDMIFVVLVVGVLTTLGCCCTDRYGCMCVISNGDGGCIRTTPATLFIRKRTTSRADDRKRKIAKT